MPITGSQLAPTQARAGLRRAGAWRAGYFRPNLIIQINGVDRTSIVETDSLNVSHALNDDQRSSQCSFTIKPQTSVSLTVGHSVIVALGHVDGYREFAGQILKTTYRRVIGVAAPWIDVECVDWTHLFDRRLIRTSFDYAPSGSDNIAAAIVDNFTAGFTRVNVQSGLPVIEFLSCELEPPSSAFRRMAEIINGGFYIDAFKDVHFFGAAGETGPLAPTAPLTLTNTLPSLKAFSHDADDAQRRTRVFVQTKGSQASADVSIGFLAAPIDDPLMFSPAGGSAFIPSVATFDYGVCHDEVDGAEVTAPVMPGDTSIAVSSTAVFVGVAGGYPGWAILAGQYLYYTGGGGGFLTGIPASGPGAIVAEVDTSIVQPINNVPFLGDLSAILPRSFPTGQAIAALTIVDDAAAQTALATAEGGDGIREAVVSAEDFEIDDAQTIGDNDLDVYSSALVTVRWDTEDLNARVGARQVVTMTGADALSVTVTITRVSVDFYARPTHLPRRHCEASAVRASGLIDAVLA